MKICLIAPRVSKVKGAFIGGSVNNVVNLSKELAKKHTVHLITTPPFYQHSSTALGIDWCVVHQLNIKGDLSNLQWGTEFLIKAIRAIIRLNKKEKFDVINSHSGIPKLGLVTGIAAQICGISSIHTQYTPIISPSKVDKLRHSIFSSQRLLSSPIFSKLYFSKLDCIVSVSENVAKSVSKVFNKKIEVIPPCIDVSRFDSSDPDLNLKIRIKSGNEKIILFLGEKESKGIKVLVEAIKEVKKEREVKVVIIGSPDNKQIREKIKKIEDSVILLDVVNMSSILPLSDIFVAPFLSTFDISDCPLSVLEAMAAGKVVIASNIGGIPEIIEHERNGILVEPGNFYALAKAILSLLEDEEKRKRLGENAYISVRRTFSAEKIAERYIKLYEEIATAKK